MNKEKYISLELAKAIEKERERIGMDSFECEYVWRKGSEFSEYAWYIIEKKSIWSNDERECISAYDNYELGEILRKRDLPIFSDEKSGWMDLSIPLHTSAKTETESRGKLLLYLLENDLIK